MQVKPHSKIQNILFFAVMAFMYIGASMAHPVTPTLIKNMNFGSYIFGAALAMQLLTNFLFSPFWGRLCSYLGSRVCLFINGIGYALGQYFFLAAKTEAQLLLARAFSGIFCGGFFVCFLTYTVNISAEGQTGKNLTVLATIQSVFGAFGYFVGGMLGEIDIYVSLWAQVAVLFLSGVFGYLVCNDDRDRNLPKLNLNRVAKDANPFSAFVQSRSFMTGMLAVMFIVCCLAMLGYYAFEQAFNYYIKDQFLLTSGYNGTIKAVSGIITLVVNSTVCLWLMKHTNVRHTLIYIIGLGAVAGLGLVFFDTVVPFMVAYALAYAFNAISIPMFQDILVKDAKPGSDRNLVMGCYNAYKSLGGIIGSLAAGFLYDVGVKMPFILAVIVMVIATAGALWYFAVSRKTKA